MKLNFLNDEDLYKIANEVMKKNPQATLWDMFVYILTCQCSVDPSILWILSDLPIIELVAKGYNLQYISDFLMVNKATVEKICETWNLFLFEHTLDFDPVEVYAEDMTFEDLQRKLRPVLAIMPNAKTLQESLSNAQKYHNIRKFLDEQEL
jgi:hypothetical protein